MSNGSRPSTCEASISCRYARSAPVWPIIRVSPSPVRPSSVRSSTNVRCLQGVPTTPVRMLLTRTAQASGEERLLPAGGGGSGGRLLSRDRGGVVLARGWQCLRRAAPLLVAVALVDGAGSAAVASGATYRNPIQARIPGGGRVESCADPSIIRAQDGDWYVYCTTDPLNDQDVDSAGAPRFHLIPILRSYDLVHWRYAGDAFAGRPDWVADSAGLWAPHVVFRDGLYFLYYTASDTSLPGGGSAIGVATAPAPTGPWTDAGAPVVEPQPRPQSSDPSERRWVYDPFVLTTPQGIRYLFYGSFFGGISARVLSPDGLHT